MRLQAFHRRSSDETYPFTIIGFYPSIMQRFATHLQAASPEEAEELCVAKHPSVAVCGVLAGHQQCMDKAEHVTVLPDVEPITT